MADENFTLTTFYKQWQAYQAHIKDAVAPLSAEQLAIRPAPHLRSIGENAVHIITCRVGWWTLCLGEDARPEVKAYLNWDEPGAAPAATTPTGAELAQGLDDSWQLMADSLARWSPDDMRQTFPDEQDGEIVQLSRAWVVWHVLEHDLHHGGELSLMLGMNNLHSEFTS